MQMPMIATVEVRWFRPGPVPEEVQAWFSELPGPRIDQPRRIDSYLRIPGEVSLGVKIREGRIEIKQRSASHGLVLFQQGLVGRVAGWRKWQFLLGDPAGNFPAAAVDRSCWFAVAKERRLRRLRMTAGGGYEPASPETLLNHGCDLEITRIRLENSRWWTLALEAYGPEDRLYETLTRVAAGIFETPFPQSLHEANSLAYPGWLQGGGSLANPAG